MGISKKFLLVSAAVSAYMPIQVWAQDANGDIIVTARRTEERLQDVPISVTVFNQQDLARRNIVNSADLANYTPSLSTNGNFGTENTTFAIRGFVQDTGTPPSVGVYFNDVVAPRGASNGIPTGDGAGPGSFFDLQNVQVLKGPQGTLFGRNTTGGAVLLVPQKPTDKFEGYILGSAGNYGMWRVQGVLNLPLSETFRLRVGVDHQERRGYLHNTSGIGPDNLANVDYTAVRVSLVGDLTPDIENYTVGSYGISNTNGSLNKTVACDRTSALNPTSFLRYAACAQLNDQAAKGEGFYDVRQDLDNPQSRLRQWQVINTTTWKATDGLTLKNIISYAQLKDDLNVDLFGTAFNTNLFKAPFDTLYGTSRFTAPFNQFDFSQVRPVPGGNTADESTFTEEFRLQGATSDGKLTWQAGGYAELVRPIGLAGSQTPSVNYCPRVANFQCSDVAGAMLSYFVTNATHVPTNVAVGSIGYTAGQTRYNDFGVYSQATYKLSNLFKITAGLRYTWDKEAADTQQFNYLGFPAAPNVGTYSALKCSYPGATNATTVTVANLNKSTDCIRNFRQASSAPTWLVDFDFTPTDATLLYAKWSRGYRAGGVSPNITSDLAIFLPEKVDTYELGLKQTFRGKVRGVFNAALFYNDFRNQQLQIGFNAKVPGSITPTAAPVNAGKSRIWGIELDGSVTPLAGLTLSGAYSYLNTKLLQVTTITLAANSPYVVGGQELVGDPLVLSPKNKFNASIAYTLPFDESIGKVTFGGTYIYVGKQLSNYGDRNSPDPTIAALSNLPSYHLVNLNLDWVSVAKTPFDLSFFVTNLTKEKYFTFVSGLGAPGGSGFETAQLGQPRMMGVTVKYHFGS